MATLSLGRVNPGTLNQAPGNLGVYWKGADGNVYVKGGKGTNVAGRVDGNTDAYWQSHGYASIADPNAPKASSSGGSAPGNPNNSGGAAAPPKPDKSNDIAMQMAMLGALDQQTAAGMASVDKSLNTVMGRYDQDRGDAEKQYGDSTVTNQGNLQKNKQSAYENASQGRQGLFGTLASLGALNGSGIRLANDAVKKGANEDLEGAANNYGTNAQTLDSAIGNFRKEDDRRREDARNAADATRTNIRGNTAKSRQAYYTQLVNDYSEMGDAGNAKRYTDMASSLAPEIASANVPAPSIAYQGAAFSAPSLESYLAGAGSTQVSSTPAQAGNPSAAGLPGLVAQNKKKQIV